MHLYSTFNALLRGRAARRVPAEGRRPGVHLSNLLYAPDAAHYFVNEPEAIVKTETTLRPRLPQPF